MRNNFSVKLTDNDIYEFLKEHYDSILIGDDPKTTGVLTGITRNEDGSIEWTKSVFDHEKNDWVYAHLEFSDLGCTEYKGYFDSRKTSDRYKTIELPYLKMMSKKFKDSEEYKRMLKSFLMGKSRELKEYFRKFQADILNNNSDGYKQVKSFYDKETKYLDELCKAVLGMTIEELSLPSKAQPQPA